jgi:hypothetical protein
MTIYSRSAAVRPVYRPPTLPTVCLTSVISVLTRSLLLQASNRRAWATSIRFRRERACTIPYGFRRIASLARVVSSCRRTMKSWTSTLSFMGRPRSGGYGAGVGRCKRRIFGGSTQSTSGRRCPNLTACGGEMHMGMELELTVCRTVQYMGVSVDF